MELDVAGDVLAQLAHQRVALARRRDADGVGDPDAVHAHVGDRPVYREQIALRGAEGVLRGEAHLLAVLLDEADHRARLVDDLLDALAVGELAQDRGGAEEDVDTVDAGLDGDARVVHVAADVGEDLRAERQGGDGLAILVGLRAGDRGGQLDVLDTELVQGLGDLDLLLRGEMGAGELLALAERRVDDRVAVERHASSSRAK
jgi:hypothetical protein